MIRRVVALVGGAIVLASVAVACGGEREPATIGRDGSTVVTEPELVLVGEVPRAYAVTYRIEELDGDDLLVREARLLVVRPYRSRFEVEDARIERVADFGYMGRREPGRETEILTAIPAPAPGDVRADAIPLGFAREVREVIGRPCQVRRFGASLLEGLYVQGDTVEACIDADGLVLEEVTTVGGEIIARRIATAVDLAPAFSDSDFRIEGVRTRSPDEGGGSIRGVEPTTWPPGEYWQLDELPDGFRHRGRYATVPPQAARLDDELTRAQYIAGMTDVYERGFDTLVIEQGATLGQVPPFGVHPHGRPIRRLGELALAGEAVQHPNGAEIRVLLPPGRYVKVSGTLPAEELITIARTLRPVMGEGLVYLDEEG